MPACSAAAEAEAAAAASGLRQGGILEYLAREQPDSLSSLYDDEYTSVAVFRSLPAFAKFYVLQALSWPPDSAIPERAFLDLLRSTDQAHTAHRAAIAVLKRLHLLSRTADDAKLVFCTRFCGRLQNSLCTLTVDEGSKLAPDSRAPTEEMLVQAADDKWNRVLHYMIGSKQLEAPSSGVQALLQSMGLVNWRKDGSASPTSLGLIFMFKDLYSQLWTVMVGYIATLQKRRMDRLEALSFMFRLGFLECGKDYATADLTKTQALVVEDLSQLGLIYKSRSKSRRYYPTLLAICLSAGSSLHSRGNSSKILINVETTFKVYAYTCSDLDIALLRLFVSLESRLPNLIVGKITKRSIRNALSIGITAEAMINFLVQNAHPESRKPNVKPVPDNVSDQIRLWEKERLRLNYAPSTLFRGFTSEAEFNELFAFAEQGKLVLWSNARKQMFVTTPEGVDAVRDYRNQKAAAVS